MAEIGARGPGCRHDKGSGPGTYDNSEILKQYQPKIIKPKICGIYVFHISRSCNKRAVPTKSIWFIGRAHIKSCFNMRALPS